jgi:hypothetical protein
VADPLTGDEAAEPAAPPAGVSANGQADAHAAEPEPFFRPSARDMVINQRRFGIAYLVLAIGVGIAVGLGVVLVGRSGSNHSATGPAGFRADQHGELGAREIANHVMHEYKGTTGDDLVGVVGQRPSFQNVGMHDDLVRPSDAQTSQDTKDIQLGNGIMYLMCGSGKNCTITGSGPATTARTLLVEQEALELTLRTFKNDSAVKTVTVLLPPVSTTNGSGQDLVAVALRKDFAPLIDRPLSSTIDGAGPYGDGSVSKTTARAIRRYFEPDMYLYRADYLPDGTPTLILDPYPHGV